MKRTISPLFFVLTALAASCLTPSCTTPSSTKSYAHTLEQASYTDVQGFNGRMNPRDRVFESYGALPDNARRALVEYIATGEWQTADYVHPQHFIMVNNSCWAICTDTRNNMKGILIMRGSKHHDARLFPTAGPYHLIVNKTDEADALSYAILKNLKYSDSYRRSIRSREGLTTADPILPTKPVTSAIKKTAPAPVAALPKAETTATPADSTSSDDSSSPFDDDFSSSSSSESSSDSSSSSDDSSESSSSDSSSAFDF